jgi:integrase
MLSIRRRGKVFHARGTVRVGRQIRKVNEHSTGCREREAARDYLHRLEAEIRDEILNGPAGRARRLTCAEAMHLYLDRPGGLHRMDVWRLGELGDVLGDVPVSDVLTGWARFKAKRCTGLAPATVDRFRDTLQAAINHAAGEHGFKAPVLPHVKFDNQRVRFLTKHQREALLAAYAPHVRPIALTLCFQGCRTQEALQLLWGDVDLERETLWLGRTKTGDPRTTTMHPRVLDALEAMTRGDPTDHVFLSARGRPYSDTRDYKLPGGNPLRKAHATACRRAGIRNFTVHDWRHHWASHMVMAGADLLTIQAMGGWSRKSLRMLGRYAAVSTEHQAAAIRRVA